MTTVDEERARAGMAARKLIQPLQVAIETLRVQQRQKKMMADGTAFSEEQFETDFRKSLNLALMFVYVGLSLDLELEPEQILSNTQNVINLVLSTRQHHQKR